MSGKLKYALALAYRAVLSVLLVILVKQYLLPAGNLSHLNKFFLLLAFVFALAAILLSIFLVFLGVLGKGLMTSGWDLYNEFGFFEAEKLIAAEVVSSLLWVFPFALFMLGMAFSLLAALIISLLSGLFKMKMMPPFIQSAGKALDFRWPLLWFSKAR